MTNKSYFKATFRLLGCDILVRCTYKACLDEIIDYFPTLQRNPDVTPDLIIDIEWEHAGKYLFRGRPDTEKGTTLKGVYVHSLGMTTDSEWNVLDPPIPPFVLSPIRDRFVGFHGGAVQTPDNAVVMILGSRGSGKTTIILTLANDYNCRVLTDESIFLHRRTRLIEPFPQPAGILTVPGNPKSKRPVRSDQVFRSLLTQPAIATHLMFLEPSKTLYQFGRLHSNATFQRLLIHARAAGSTFDEAVVTMFQLATELPSAEVHYITYNELKASAEMILNFAQRQQNI
jgi:hypothetical protein